MNAAAKLLLTSPLLLATGFCLACCNPRNAAEDPAQDAGANASLEETVEAVSVSSIRPRRDPINDEIFEFRVKVRELYNQRQFDELEKLAKEIRASKETFGNGSWKLLQFYGAFEPQDEEPETMWKLHERIHQDWLDAHPDSITAHVSFIDFLTQYAWHARGSGYADTVTEEGWKWFKERLDLALETIQKAKGLEEKDAVLHNTELRVALGQGWSKESYEAVLEEAHRQEPQFWGYEVARAYSLLPRWHGEPGEWDAYAEKASAREGGLGKEIYARIVLHLDRYYDNIFEESRADWQTTKEGLEILLGKHPESLELPNAAVLLAAKAQDRDFAARLFDTIGDRYYKRVWRDPERFVKVRNWAKAAQ